MAVLLILDKHTVKSGGTVGSEGFKGTTSNVGAYFSKLAYPKRSQDNKDLTLEISGDLSTGEWSV